ncbi:MAG: hypothetical protein ACRBCS_02285 [Cellvibrionaceae bacterium]
MKIKHLVLPLALCCSSAVFAANNGTLGATSTGDTDVTITIGDVVQVSVEQDVNLTYTPGVDSTGTTGLCIYRNSDADVDVTLTSANDNAGAFRMADGTNFITYSVDLSGSTTALTGIASAFLNTLSDEDNTSSSCSGGYSHDLDVTVTAANLDAAQAGTYSDTVTVLVAPN